MKDPLLYVDHILQAIHRIEEYVVNCNWQTFSKDQMRYDAILRNLQTMAESTQRLPKQLKERYLHIPWGDISGFRNVLVHDYLGELDEEKLWLTIKHDLKPLKNAMEEILNQHEK